MECELLVPVFMKKSDKKAAIELIEADVLRLSQSPLFSYRVQNGYMPVVGEGSLDAKILFVGEAPGKNEAVTGRPFCGAAGKILDALLSGVNLERKNVYITSLVKDRPPENRPPTLAEIDLYAPFLDRQIELIGPKVVVTLGRHAMEYVMKRYGLESSLRPIGTVHGTFFSGKTESGSTLRVLPLYHPAAALYRRPLLKTLEADFAVLKRVV